MSFDIGMTQIVFGAVILSMIHTIMPDYWITVVIKSGEITLFNFNQLCPCYPCLVCIGEIRDNPLQDKFGARSVTKFQKG